MDPISTTIISEVQVYVCKTAPRPSIPISHANRKIAQIYRVVNLKRYYYGRWWECRNWGEQRAPRSSYTMCNSQRCLHHCHTGVCRHRQQPTIQATQHFEQKGWSQTARYPHGVVEHVTRSSEEDRTTISQWTTEAASGTITEAQRAIQNGDIFNIPIV